MLPDPLILTFPSFGQRSIKQAAAKIKELTGITRRQNRVRLFLKSIGLKRYKVGTIPAKADLKKSCSHLWRKPQLVTEPSFLGFLGSLTRIFIQAPAGRKRFNVLGALNVIKHPRIYPLLAKSASRSYFHEDQQAVENSRRF